MSRVVLALVTGLLSSMVPNAFGQAGKAVYEKSCALCHGPGIAGAPKFGEADDWTPRIAKGVQVLYGSALNGTPRGMPARGGNLELKDAEVRAAVDYMLGRVQTAKPAAKPAPAPRDAAQSAAKQVAPAAAVAPPPAPPAAPAAQPAATASVQVMNIKAAPSAGDADVNSFNRLLRPAGSHNRPPAEDGIHDPNNEGTHALQPPLAAYAGLPRSNAGNRVNWVASLDQKRIQPRWDRTDPKAEPVVMDLNIVREVKGSMPDVVYPHKQHTEWLDCSNCHPQIFVPQKGANQISMASILMGQGCGVCHGKVAFPVSECRLCHSKKKDVAASTRAPAATSPR